MGQMQGDLETYCLLHCEVWCHSVLMSRFGGKGGLQTSTCSHPCRFSEGCWRLSKYASLQNDKKTPQDGEAREWGQAGYRLL